jgi:hypothetical protein
MKNILKVDIHMKRKLLESELLETKRIAKFEM